MSNRKPICCVKQTWTQRTLRDCLTAQE